MEDNTTVVSNGFSISGLLGVTFIILKLNGVIDWSWWWVLAPFWIPIVLGIILLVLL